MVSRSRLSKGSTRMKNGRLKTQITSELKSLPTVRVKKYATLSDKSVMNSPVLSSTRDAAKKELAFRQQSMSLWKTGKVKSEPTAAKVATGAKKVAELAGKGFQEYMKLISGAKAQELEEWIATAGMKPEDKKKVVAKIQRERQEAEQLAPSKPEPVDDLGSYKVADVSDSINKELAKSKKELWS